ncbi:MAG: hypothetical protein MUE85_18430 [Microscillaceae bacterium]|jgi:hypothetical protein|nr:hypothetical protein [Microscillaceae bacterium]
MNKEIVFLKAYTIIFLILGGCESSDLRVVTTNFTLTIFEGTYQPDYQKMTNQKQDRFQSNYYRFIKAKLVNIQSNNLYLLLNDSIRYNHYGAFFKGIDIGTSLHFKSSTEVAVIKKIDYGKDIEFYLIYPSKIKMPYTTKFAKLDSIVSIDSLVLFFRYSDQLSPNQPDFSPESKNVNIMLYFKEDKVIKAKLAEGESLAQ